MNQTSFLLKLQMVSFFLWLKSSWLNSKSLIFFGSIVFRFGRHSLALLVQVGLVKPIRTAFSARYIAAATWLHVFPIPAIHVQWQVLIFAFFLSITHCLLTEIFYILHWWYSIYFLKDYGIPNVEAILIHSNCMLCYFYSQ